MRLFGGTPPGMPFTGRSAESGPPRHLTADDIDGWMKAASQRNPPRKMDRRTLQDYLKAKNLRRWNRLQRELRWAEKELGKLGLNPEDARWMI